MPCSDKKNKQKGEDFEVFKKIIKKSRFFKSKVFFADAHCVKFRFMWQNKKNRNRHFKVVYPGVKNVEHVSTSLTKLFGALLIHDE